MRRTFEHERGAAAGFGEGEGLIGRLERFRELRPGILRVGIGARGQSDNGAIGDESELAQIRRAAAVDQRGVDQDGAFPVASAAEGIRAEVQDLRSQFSRIPFLPGAAYVTVQSASPIATRGSPGRTLPVPRTPGAPV